MYTTKAIAAVMVLLASAGASGANAAKCSGYNINSAMAFDTNELSSGASMSTLRVTSVHVSEDPSSPMHLAAGECSGSITATPDGKAQGQGHCMRKDKDGDVYNEQWNLPPGAEKGTWKLVGGSGKYVNMTGSGWWQVTMSQGKTTAVRWVGSCQ
ncbi:MAG: hypothetical protein IT532_12665 [Burkholderiales bacterium]|nr:hypothetical protein [Burkholderiales bacterium]